MSTQAALPARREDVSEEEVLKAMGLSKPEYEITLPRLAVNYNSEDDQKRSVQRGVFVVKFKDAEGKLQTVYGNKAEFALSIARINYTRYDNATKKTVARSIYGDKNDYFKAVDLPDSAGGYKAGYLPGKLREDGVDENGKKKFRPQTAGVKANLHLFGVVNMQGEVVSGVDSKGRATYTDYEIKDLPVRLILRGQSMGDMLGFLKDATDVDKNYMVLTLVKGEGAIDYWNIESVKGKPHEIPWNTFVELLGNFQSLIVEENKLIMDSHVKVTNGEPIGEAWEDDEDSVIEND